MCPFITIFGFQIGTYALCTAGGAGIALLIASLFLYKPYEKSHTQTDLVCAAVLAMMGVFIGGKLLYILINIKDIITYWPKIMASEEGIKMLLSNGFVFYGGLIGAVLMLLMYCKLLKVSMWAVILNIVPVIPIVHGFGRIGCFMAGCCYGIEYHGIGHVVFSHAVGGAPSGVELFPVQLVEAVCNFGIAALLFWYHKRKPYSSRCIGIYAVCYACVRFALEFFRGDAERKLFWGISTSQWISILMVLIGIVLIVKEKNIQRNIDDL